MINVIHSSLFSAPDVKMLDPSINQSLITQIIFIATVALIFLIYLGYPILMFALCRLIPRPVRRIEIQPRVSLIIAAHNEERDIGEKLENALALDYPKDL